MDDTATVPICSTSTSTSTALLTVDYPVVLLPPGDKMAPAQDKVLRAHDSARKRALGPAITAIPFTGLIDVSCKFTV